MLMRGASCIWLACAAAAATSAAAFSPHACVKASNFLDAQYTVAVSVGTSGQTLECVMDSGSSEFIVSVRNESVLTMEHKERRGFGEAAYDCVVGLGVSSYRRDCVDRRAQE